MSNGNDDDFENTTKKYFLVVKIFFVFNCNWNWKCLGEKSPKHLFFGKNWNFFGSIFTRFTRGLSSLKGLQKRGVWSKSKSRVCKNGACGRRATGGLLLGLSEEQQGGLLLPGLAPGRIYSVCNIGCWRTIRSEAFDDFGATCTLPSITNKECSV
jgi:hypothetical protein